MNDRQIQYFLSVANGNTFTATAEIFHISQPTISSQISALEDELNAKLLVRKLGGTELTEAGKMYQKFFLDVEKEFLLLREEIQQMKRSRENSLSLGIFSDLNNVIMPILESFFQENPDVNMQMNIMRRSDFLSRQMSEKLDIVIAFDNLTLDLDEYICRPLFKSPQLLFYSKKLAERLGPNPDISAFQDMVFLMLDDEVSGGVIQQIKELFCSLSLAIPRFEMIKNVKNIVLKVMQNRGVAVLSESAFPHFFPYCNSIELPFGFNVACYEYRDGLPSAAKIFRDRLLEYYS